MNKKLNTEEIKRVSVDKFKDIPKIPLIIILDNIRSMHNIGSVFRTADAFCIEKVILCGITATPPNSDIHKSALGAEFSVDWEYSDNSKTSVQKLKSDGYITLAAELTQNSKPLHTFNIDKNKKYAVVLGNEVFGVEQDTIDICDNCIEIPQFGTKHSLNISVAAGIVMWKFLENLKF